MKPLNEGGVARPTFVATRNRIDAKTQRDEQKRSREETAPGDHLIASVPQGERSRNPRYEEKKREDDVSEIRAFPARVEERRMGIASWEYTLDRPGGVGGDHPPDGESARDVESAEPFHRRALIGMHQPAIGRSPDCSWENSNPALSADLSETCAAPRQSSGRISASSSSSKRSTRRQLGCGSRATPQATSRPPSVFSLPLG